ISETGNPIRRKCSNLFAGIFQSKGGLERKPINKIKIQPVDPNISQIFRRVNDSLNRLNATDRCLNRGIDILHTKACSVDLHGRQGFGQCRSNGAWVKLDCMFRLRMEIKTTTKSRENARKLFGGKYRWCSATPMQMLDLRPDRQIANNDFNFMQKRKNEAFYNIVTQCHFSVAAAIVADLFAIRDMNIE